MDELGARPDGERIARPETMALAKQRHQLAVAEAQEDQRLRTGRLDHRDACGKSVRCELDVLGAHPEGSANDGCRASCVDWYGNARPLFLRGRVFALLGYEIVEGELAGGKIREKRRTNFAPPVVAIAR